MDVLVALGTSVADLFSSAVLLFNIQNHVYFEAAAVVITLVLLGTSCEGCVKSVTRALQGVAGVQHVEVSLAGYEAP